MYKYMSFLADIIYKFIDFMVASQHWSETYEKHLRGFDKYLWSNYPSSTCLSQEMIDAWCHVRASESINANLARTSVVVAFIRYLQRRGLSDVKEPERPKPQKCTHIPYAFTVDELTNFFYACDHSIIRGNRKDSLIKKMILCVIFVTIHGVGMISKVFGSSSL